MINPAFGSSYLLSIIPSLKPQPTKAILDALRSALNANDKEAAYGALAATLYGDTPITSEFESFILRRCSAESSKLRAVSFGLAIRSDLKTLRSARVHQWSDSLEA